MSNIYEQAGAMHFLPGMKFSIECLVREVVAMKQRAGIPTSDARTLSDQVVAVLLGNGTATIIEAKAGAGKTRIVPFLEQQALLSQGPVISAEVISKQPAWTDEKRAAYSQRMSEARKAGAIKPKREVTPQEPKVVKYEHSVQKIGDGLTVYGLAKELGVTVYRVRSAIARLHVRGKRVDHPVNTGAKVDTYPITVTERLRKAIAKVTQGQKLPNHPRNANHPKHEEWRQLMSQAQLKRAAKQKQAAKLKQFEEDIAYVNGAAS